MWSSSVRSESYLILFPRSELSMNNSFVKEGFYGIGKYWHFWNIICLGYVQSKLVWKAIVNTPIWLNWKGFQVKFPRTLHDSTSPMFEKNSYHTIFCLLKRISHHPRSHFIHHHIFLVPLQNTVALANAIPDPIISPMASSGASLRNPSPVSICHFKGSFPPETSSMGPPPNPDWRVKVWKGPALNQRKKHFGTLLGRNWGGLWFHGICRNKTHAGQQLKTIDFHECVWVGWIQIFGFLFFNTSFKQNSHISPGYIDTKSKEKSNLSLQNLGSSPRHRNGWQVKMYRDAQDIQDILKIPTSMKKSSLSTFCYFPRLIIIIIIIIIHGGWLWGYPPHAFHESVTNSMNEVVKLTPKSIFSVSKNSH